MLRAQRMHGYCAPIGQCQILSTGCADPHRREPGRLGGTDQQAGVRHGQQVATLVLAEPVGMTRDLPRAGEQPDAGQPRHRHLRQRDQQSAVRYVVAGTDIACEDLSAHEVPGRSLCWQVNRRRRALLPAGDLAQPERLA